MRVPLPQIRTNGHTAPHGQVFALTGMCQDPHFRLRGSQLGGDNDLCLIYFGASGFGEAPSQATGSDETDPYFVLRRQTGDGEVTVAVRVDWEGIFTILSNDDEAAESAFHELIEPSRPEEVTRQWSDDASTLEMFFNLIHLR